MLPSDCLFTCTLFSTSTYQKLPHVPVASGRHSCRLAGEQRPHRTCHCIAEPLSCAAPPANTRTGQYRMTGTHTIAWVEVETVGI